MSLSRRLWVMSEWYYESMGSEGRGARASSTAEEQEQETRALVADKRRG
jgi:hypothetical protein